MIRYVVLVPKPVPEIMTLPAPLVTSLGPGWIPMQVVKAKIVRTRTTAAVIPWYHKQFDIARTFISRHPQYIVSMFKYEKTLILDNRGVG